MLRPAESERLARVGPGTPLGAALRKYWLPACLSKELPEPDGAPIRVRLLGEDLVAFRDSDGGVGLVSAFCPHRRAPMFFGRNEASGLRCVYHGWKFDRNGTCVDMPSEPPVLRQAPDDNVRKTEVRIEAYPTYEAGGIVWSCLDPLDAPPPPAFELLRVPDTHRIVTKTFEECNYLQALEGGLDNVHAAILHRRSVKGDLSFLRDYHRLIPKVEVRRTPYGYAFSAVRQMDGKQWARISQFFMPTMQLRGTVQMENRHDNRMPTLDGHIWVPVDDLHTWVYNFTYAYFPDQPLPEDLALELEVDQGRGPGDVTHDYKLVRNRTNDYLIDRTMQKRGNFTGIAGVNTQDYALQENMEPIVDRTKEHLGSIDLPIIAVRQLLLEACDDVAAGKPPRGVDPETHRTVRAADHFIAAGLDWADALRVETETRY